jgi:hypothetical protein
MSGPLLSTYEVARVLSLSPWSMRQLVRRGVREVGPQTWTVGDRDPAVC